MKIVIASDHGGYALKSHLFSFLRQAQLGEVADLGCHSPDSVDYPDYAKMVAEKVAHGKANFGILVCGTGVGMSITANKIKGIRAAMVGDPYSARISREHNDANVLCVGARVVGTGLAEDIVSAFLKTPFAGQRHIKRLEKINAIEAKHHASKP